MNASAAEFDSAASARPVWGRAVLFGLAYFGCAVVGRAVALPPGVFVAFWLPSGLFVATLLLNERRQWPWFVLAAWGANVGFELWNGQPLPVSLSFFCGNALEAMAGAWLAQRFVAPRPSLETVREVCGLSLFSALLSTMLGATVGAAAITFLLGAESYWPTWLLWWMGNAMGVLLLAPLILTWSKAVRWPSAVRLSAGHAAGGAWLLVLIGFTFFVFNDAVHPHLALKYALIPAIGFAALRFGLRGATLANLAVAVVAAGMTAHGLTDISSSGLSPSGQAAALLLFLSVLAFCGLIPAALLAERKRVEQALREGEQTYRSLFENMREGAFRQRADGVLFDINPAALAMFGVTRNEFCSRTSLSPAWDVVREDASPWPGDEHPSMQALRTGQPVSGAVIGVFNPQTHNRVWAEIHAVPEFLPGGSSPHQVLVTLHDVTERKWSEELIRAQRDLALKLASVGSLAEGLHLCLGHALKAAGCDAGAIYLVDAESGAVDLLDAQGLSADFIRAVSHYDPQSDYARCVTAGRPIYGPRDPSGLPAAEALQREGLRFLAAIPLHHEGRVIGCLNIASHSLAEISPPRRAALEAITAGAVHAIGRLQAEESLQRSRAELRAIYEHAPVLMCLLDPARRVLYANRAFTEFTGLPEAELLQGRACGVFGCINAADHPAGCGFGSSCATCSLRQAIEDTLQTGHSHRDVEYHATLEQGGRRRDVILLAATARMGVPGRPSVLLCLSDITSRVQAEEELRQVPYRLLRAEDDERRRIARELHDSTAQDLVAVIMGLDQVRERIAGQAGHEARRLEDHLAVLEKCAHDIRTLSYLLHPPRLDEAGLAGAVRHYAQGFGERTGIAMTLDLPEDLGRLAEDVELVLFRVVQECLGNIHRHAGSPTASIRLAHEAAGTVLEVSDAGRGIPPAVLTALEGAGPGLGVGIPAMRERLRQIGGRLRMESGPRGTTVRATLGGCPLSNRGVRSTERERIETREEHS